MADFRFEDHGSVVLVTPLTPDAETFVETECHVESWQYMGPSIGMDTRMALQFRELIIDQGFSYQ